MDILSDINPVEKRIVSKATIAEIPISATFELTPICNFRCEMCYVRMDKNRVESFGGIKEYDYWLRLADELKKEGTLFLLLTGGEPLLYPNFLGLYIALKKMGFIITINTNATLITEEVADVFSKYPPRRINVTLYGVDNDDYRSVCKVESGFDRCIRGVELLKKYNIATKFTLTLIENNRKSYQRMIELATRLDIHATINAYTSVYMRSQCGSCDSILNVRMLPEDAAALEVEYLKYSKKEEFGKYMALMSVLSQSQQTSLPEGLKLSCRAGRSSCWINWQGVMTPCVDMDEPSVNLNNENFHDAWRAIVQKCKKLTPHSECKDCTLKHACDICYANASNEKRVNGSVCYLCKMAEAKRDIFSSFNVDKQ